MPSGSRVRSNSVFGTVADNPLTSISTTLTSNQLVLLPSINTGSAHAVITLDPLRQYGDPEIVVVTAHTPASSVATIVRGTYGTGAREHPFGTVWTHAALDEDFTEIVTSSTRPSDPYEGQLIYETDTDKYVGRSSAGVWQDAIPLGAWQTYSPSNTNVTLGNGVERAFYTRIGSTVHVSYELVFGTTTAFTGNIAIGLPFVSANSPQRSGWYGPAHGFDAGTNFRILHGRISSGGNSITFFQDSSTTGNINATTPFTWANTDSLRFSITYEAA